MPCRIFKNFCLLRRGLSFEKIFSRMDFRMRRLLLLRFELEFNKFARLALTQGVQVKGLSNPFLIPAGGSRLHGPHSNGIFMVVVIIGISQNVDFFHLDCGIEIAEVEDVPDISPYLTALPTVFIKNRREPLSDLPQLLNNPCFTQF